MARRRKEATEEAVELGAPRSMEQQAETRPDKGRGGKYNFPNARKPPKPGEIAETMTPLLYWMGMPKVDSKDTDAIEQRTWQYFEWCVDKNVRPTVEAYALALGYVRSTIFKWEQAGGTRGTIIKRAKEVLAAMDAADAMAGKIRDAPYIFRGKNYYGMSDIQAIEVTAKAPIVDESAQEVARKYAELPED